jgi:very-short-patch-repair endonuclease
MKLIIPNQARMPEWKRERARHMRKVPTEAEAVLWQMIRRRALGVKFRRQAPLYGYIADFWCPELRLVVEVDGKVHDERRKEDARRDAHLRRYDVTTQRYTNEEVLSDAAAVCDHLMDVIDSLRGDPSHEE